MHGSYFIYFLVKNKKVIYIGHTMNIPSRIKSHSIEHDFDYVKMVKCLNKESALAYEKRWQRVFSPRYNKNGIQRPEKIKSSSANMEPKITILKSRVRVNVSIDKKQYSEIVKIAERDSRSISNYISWCITRGIRNDLFFTDPLEMDIDDKFEMRIVKRA